MTFHPRVFFSFRSPFSWLAIERLLRLVPNAHEIIDFIPYWEPDPYTTTALEKRGTAVHYVAMSKAKHLYILQDTKRLAESMGLTMVWPVDTHPWWEPSHLGWLQARRQGCAPEFYAAVVAARWQRAENISDPNVIGAIAASVQLDPDAIAGAVDDPAVRAEGVDCLSHAYDDDIFGVPYFRLGRQRFWGIDRIELFLAALDPSAHRPKPGTESAQSGVPVDRDPLQGVPQDVRDLVGSYDNDSAGACG